MDVKGKQFSQLSVVKALALLELDSKPEDSAPKQSQDNGFDVRSQAKLNQGQKRKSESQQTVNLGNIRHQVLGRGRRFLEVGSSRWIEPTQGRGRLKKEIPSLNELESKPVESQKQKIASKNVICNAMGFTASPIYEYSINFEPEINIETRRIGFLNKHFSKINKTFIYDKFSVFVPTFLPEHELNCNLSNRSNASLFTMSLKFQQVLDLTKHPVLLDLIFREETPENLAVIPFLDYISNIWEVNNDCFLCLDYFSYRIEDRNINEIILEFEDRFKDRFRDALDVLLRNVSVLYKNKIFRMVKINWEDQVLILKRSTEEVKAKPEACRVAELISGPRSVREFMSNLDALFASNLLQKWCIRFGDFTKAETRVLKPETIIFGDGVEFTPKEGDWGAEMRENEVLIPIELWCWMILYTRSDAHRVEAFSTNLQKFQEDTGVSIGKPLLFEVPNTKDGYVTALKDLICKELQLIIVIVPNSPNKPEGLIKYFCCLLKPIPFQIIHSSDLQNLQKIHETVLQLNLISGGIPWTVKLPYQDWMVSGIDFEAPVCSFVTDLSNDASQWYSKAVYVEDNFLISFQNWLEDTLKKYKDSNGKFPSQILIYQNVTKETREKFRKHFKNFNFHIKLSIVFVEKNTNLYIYKDLKNPENVPPGTVLDNTVTKAPNFFLTSNSNCSTHYEIIINTAGVTQEKLELITYKMCHLFFKSPKTVQVPAPCLYAEKLGNLIRNEIHGIPSSNLDERFYYL